MAFTTTQSADSVLLRGITFRTTANAPISSQYILYANGNGQTYWSNAVLPSAISSISSYVGVTSNVFRADITALSTSVSTIQTDISTLRVVDSQLSNSIGTLSNNVNVLGNQLAAQVGNIYISTVSWVNSTLYSISSFSTFYVSTNYILSTTVEGLSTLSTSAGVQNASTYSSLTSNYTELVRSTTASTFDYVNTSLFLLGNSTTAAYTAAIDVFSSVITGQLLSTSDGLQSSLSTATGLQNDVFSDFYSSIYLSSILVDEQNISTLRVDVTDLQAFSTSISTVTYSWISTFVSTSQGIQNVELYARLQPVSTAISSIVQSTATLYTLFSNLSSAVSTTNSTTQSSIRGLTNAVSSLAREFSTLTTSSILAGVYDTFMELEEYTVGLINSTISTVSTFVSSLYYSTIVQNTSIATAYFAFYVSTMYDSTLSTLIPSTFAYMSTTISSLYSTGDAFMQSSLTSSATGITNGFVSTTSSLTYIILASTQAQMESSVRAYLSTPAAQIYSTISTLSYITLSSFNRSASDSLSTYSTIFYSTQSTNQTQFSSLYGSTQNTLLLLSTQQGLYASTNSGMLSSFSTSFSAQMSTQSSLFTSTLAVYPVILTSSLSSTNTAYVSVATSTITSSVTYVQNSTLAMYEQFVRDLNAQASTAALSTLYTSQIVNLTGSTFQRTMDFATFRNFTVNVYNPINGPSSYILTYGSNSISAIDYRAGVITINVSTVGQSYSNNGGRLRFDVYRWGIPTTIWGNLYPFMSNAAYTLQYQYMILNNRVYTNLLGVYPEVAIRSTTLSSITSPVAIGTSNGFGQVNSNFWRGSPLQVSWSNYNFFPQDALGAPPFNPEILIDMQINNSTVQQFGPYDFSVSSAIITAPYLRNVSTAVIPTKVRTYVVGKPTEALENTFNTVIPVFDSLVLYPRSYAQTSNLQFIAGGELVAVTDNGTAPLYNLPITVAGTTAVTSYSNNPAFGASNLVNGLSNISVVLAGSRAITSRTSLAAVGVGQMFENTAQQGFRSFVINFSTPYFTAMSNILFRYSNATPLRFTISSATNAAQFVSFTPNVVTPYGGGAWTVANSTLNTLTPLFTSESAQCFFTTTFSTTAYTESNFIGPIGPAADTAAYAEISGLGLSSNMNPISTLTYLNVGDSAPIATSNAHGNRLVASFTAGGQTYFSTFVLSSLSTQIFTL